MSCEIGVVGLGVMGSNLTLNFAEKGIRTAVFNRSYSRTREFVAEAGSLQGNVVPCEHMTDFVQALKVPRKALILVKAGGPTDSVIEQLCALMSPDDIIVDTGNAHFKDQGRRAELLESKGLRFLGMGISGGEEGARKGPAFFPGGTLSVWDHIRPLIEAVAAKADDGRPCVTMNGRGGAGSCVKMYHNAGEYAILQIWGEVYSILHAARMSNTEIAALLRSWSSEGFLTSYMLDITIAACEATEESVPLTELVMDKVGSKGTGLWSAQEALEVGCPAPCLNMAVVARQLTQYRDERVANAASAGPASAVHGGPGTLQLSQEDCRNLYHATLLSIIACYAQMFQCLRALDRVYEFGLCLPATIATFRSGCILKGYLLQPMTRAFEENPNLSNLLCAFPEQLAAGMKPFREVIACVTRDSNVPIPLLSTSLTYVNTMFHETLVYGQMVSLQRDVFGRHGFERLDKEGLHSHQWPEMQ